MKSKEELSNVCDWRKIAVNTALGGVIVFGGMSVSCGRKSEAEEGKKKLELVGYEVDQVGFFKAVAQDDLAALKLFTDQKFDFRVKDESGNSAVHVAADSDAVRALAYLEKSGLNLDALNNEQQTALMLAARKANLQTLEFLLKSGVETRIRDKPGKFALLYAVDAESDGAIRILAPHTRELLDTALLYAADQDKPGAVEPLVQYGASVYARNDGLTSLMLASEKGNSKVVRVLLEHGANVYAVSDEGKLARDFADENETVLNALNSTPGEVVAENDTDLKPASGDDDDQELMLEWDEKELEKVVKQAMVRYHEKDLEEFAAEQAVLAQAAEKLQPEVTAGTTGVLGGTANQRPPRPTNQGQTSSPIVTDPNKGSNVMSGGSVSANNEAYVALPPVPVVPENVEVKRLQGRELEVDFVDSAGLKEEMMMSAYAEKPLPLIMEADEAGNVEVRDLRQADSQPKSVEAGGQIGMTGLKVKEIKKKIVNSKMTGGVPKELVTMVVEDERTGRSRELYAGYESVASEAVAVVRLKGTNEHLIVTRDDTFTDSNGTMYRVMDVTKADLTVENTETGEVTLLPLLGIKRVVDKKN